MNSSNIHRNLRGFVADAAVGKYRSSELIFSSITYTCRANRTRQDACVEILQAGSQSARGMERGTQTTSNTRGQERPNELETPSGCHIIIGSQSSQLLCQRKRCSASGQKAYGQKGRPTQGPNRRGTDPGTSPGDAGTDRQPQGQPGGQGLATEAGATGGRRCTGRRGARAAGCRRPAAGDYSERVSSQNAGF